MNAWHAPARILDPMDGWMDGWMDSPDIILLFNIALDHVTCPLQIIAKDLTGDPFRIVTTITSVSVSPCLLMKAGW